MRDYSDEFVRTIEDFWSARSQQQTDQEDRGRRDTGTRGSVSAGRHLDSLEQLLWKVCEDMGLTAKRDRAGGTLPGYLRGSKTWDLVAYHDGHPAVVIELKSQVGSYGNNLNNRIEEMAGQAQDLQLAARAGFIQRGPPFFGYVMIVGDDPRAHEPIRTRLPENFTSPDPFFAGSPSYIERYAVAFSRAVEAGLISAACLAVADEERKRVYFPSPELTFESFVQSVASYVGARQHGSW